MTSPSHTSEIERELAELGEDPPTAEELAMLAEPDEQEDVAGVARLAELTEPIAFADLSELETHRIWHRVQTRVAEADEPQRAEPAERATPHPGGGGPRRWLFAAIGVAAAAAIVLIIALPSAQERLAGNEIDPKDVAELGEQVRASLKLLDDGASDTQRATQLAAEYQARLEEQGG